MSLGPTAMLLRLYTSIISHCNMIRQIIKDESQLPEQLMKTYTKKNQLKACFYSRLHLSLRIWDNIFEELNRTMRNLNSIFLYNCNISCFCKSIIWKYSENRLLWCDLWNMDLSLKSPCWYILKQTEARLGFRRFHYLWPINVRQNIAQNSHGYNVARHEFGPGCAKNQNTTSDVIQPIKRRHC